MLRHSFELIKLILLQMQEQGRQTQLRQGAERKMMSSVKYLQSCLRTLSRGSLYGQFQLSSVYIVHHNTHHRGFKAV